MQNKSDMSKYLPEIDMKKLAKILTVKQAYRNGEMDLAQAREEMRRITDKISPYEIAIAEQELREYEDDQCEKEDIQGMLALYEGLMDTSRPELPEDHPLAYYYRENDLLREQLLAIEDLVQYPVIKNQWLEIYDALDEYKVHYSRKQNQLYTVLEKKGFDRPTTTMWTLDNFVRDEINEARALLDEGKDDEFIAFQSTLVADLRDLMEKEEQVLYPTSLAMITPDEFEHMKSGDREIGFAFIEAEAAESKSADVDAAGRKDSAFAGELAQLLHKYGYANDPEAPLNVAMGELSLKQINLIYKHLPVDISYVDENEIVKFYSDTEHRVFPRSKNVIGRNVKNCHPRSSVHIVEEIIEKFRSGEEDSAEFWINKPGLFIYIYYVAVRDEEGKFKGVMEMMQDCTHIRSLEGSQTLLSWDKQDSADATGAGADAEAAGEAESETAESAEAADTADAAEAAEPAEAPKLPEKITPQTMLKDLIAVYPSLKKDMAKIDPHFKALSTPLARIMLPKADIRAMSERSGVAAEKIIAGIEELIKGYEA